MKVLIFGGKFNPLHNGHIKIIKQINKALNFDQVWLLPTGLTPKQTVMKSETRFQIIKNIANENIFIIKKQEINKNKSTPTIETVEIFKQKYNYEFNFLIGSDQLNDFSSWEEAKKLSKIVNFIVATRKGYDIKKESIKEYNMLHFECNAPQISSTEIRNGDFRHLSQKTINLLIKDKIFMENIVKNILTPKRLQHSINVAKRAQQLGKKYLPKKINDLYLAGLLHDITKEKKQKKEAQELNIYKQHKNTWHQHTGAKFVSDFLKIKNKDIISAIKKHTTADLKMNDFEKIIFCADKTSIERDYEEVERIRKSCEINLEKCFVESYRATINFLNKKNIKLDENTRRIKEKWLEK